MAEIKITSGRMFVAAMMESGQLEGYSKEQLDKLAAEMDAEEALEEEEKRKARKRASKRP